MTTMTTHPLFKKMSDAFYQNTQSWDQQNGIDSVDPSVWATRLQRTSLVAILNGDFGKRVLSQLADLPLARLSVVAVTQDDAAYLRSIRAQFACRAQQAVLIDQPVHPREISMMLTRFRMVLFATGRPFPDLASELNAVCLNNALPWLQAHLWGARLDMGPTVLPGITACYECYRRRLAANSLQQDVDDGLTQYLTRDKSFDFTGQLGAINSLAAAYVTAEVKRFLSAKYLPTTLSREMIAFPLHHGASPAYHFVAPLEWCPVCWEKQMQHASSQMPEHSLKTVVSQVMQAITQSRSQTASQPVGHSIHSIHSIHSLEVSHASR